MRILLQHTDTKLYFSLIHHWTANPRLAFNFKGSAHALDFARKNNLGNVQLVVKFEESGWEDIVPHTMHVASLSA